MSSDEPDATAPERTILQDLLADNRGEILALLDDLTDEQARRSLVPSRTTLLGIVKHAAFAEKVWLHASLPKRTRAEVGIPEDGDDSWLLDDEDTLESIAATFRATAEESDRIAASYSLDDIGVHTRVGRVSLRWMYVHLIEEFARHAGHGDIIREQIRSTDTMIGVKIDSDLMERAHRKAEARGETVGDWLTNKLAQYAEFANDVPAAERARARRDQPR